jgi:hypothetical protein
MKILEGAGWEFHDSFGYAAIQFKSPRMKNRYITEESSISVERWYELEIDSLVFEKNYYLAKVFNKAQQDLVNQYKILLKKNLPIGEKIKISIEVII